MLGVIPVLCSVGELWPHLVALGHDISLARSVVRTPLSAHSILLLVCPSFSGLLPRPFYPLFSFPSPSLGPQFPFQILLNTLLWQAVVERLSLRCRTLSSPSSQTLKTCRRPRLTRRHQSLSRVYYWPTRGTFNQFFLFYISILATIFKGSGQGTATLDPWVLGPCLAARCLRFTMNTQISFLVSGPITRVSDRLRCRHRSTPTLHLLPSSTIQ